MAEQRAVAVGIFRDQAQVREAVGALKDAGFAEGDIELLVSTPQVSTAMTDASPGKGATGEGAEAPVGGVGADVLDNTLSGVPVGAGPGVVAAGLRGYGVAAEDVRRYEEAARQGATVVAVRIRGRYDEAEALLRRAGAFSTTETPAARASGPVE